ncbi:hypothetical protein [Roseospira goensis]|uniref:Uncharacterized coiled-coil DUF342 family protein n=1 Tax=Roseospira goensis TaxID=391922 RepID=A0A7W6RZI6_9PROT|nr:hypothetical protein [Roseospira goensis]MBB4285474.1 uncharacterized coiled-coil DUF342 family protein [Roseospira goensis]
MTGSEDEKNAYITRMEAQLREWRAEVDKMRAKAEAAQADARIKWHEQADEMQRRLDEARTELDRLRNASEDAWRDVRAGFEASWGAMTDAWSRAMERFRS